MYSRLHNCKIYYAEFCSPGLSSLIITHDYDKNNIKINMQHNYQQSVPVLLKRCEVWTLRKHDINRIQSAEMKFLRRVKACTKLDRYRNEDTKIGWTIP